jgi:hypothetical protein
MNYKSFKKRTNVRIIFGKKCAVHGDSLRNMVVILSTIWLHVQYDFKDFIEYYYLEIVYFKHKMLF